MTTTPADPMSTEKTAQDMPAVPDTATVGQMKKKELIELVVARSEVRKKFAKPVVEAMLAVLGESIADGRALNLPPLGKLRINRSIDKTNAKVTVCKLRQSTDDPESKEPLAEVED